MDIQIYGTLPSNGGEGGSGVGKYYYDVSQNRYNVLVLEQYEDEWDVIAQS